ncbi:MAG: hypothetical protein AMS22_04240 [Thiotrichales bacterium SG8_50]|nr:MAG: hypothetical protein AMS22_04240 [Thiotrichales bacterium SG8_50]
MTTFDELSERLDSLRIPVHGQQIAVWPRELEVLQLTDSPAIFITRFADAPELNEALARRLFELETDQQFTHRMEMGGSKIRDMHRWGIPEADLINARAKAFFSLATGDPNPVVDLAWANISRKHEYLGPHSHNNSVGSVVYCVDPGEPDPNNRGSGRLAFVDPRIPACCKWQDDCMTDELWPDIHAGSMVLFPSQMVHFVHPYTGNRPRITIAWNILDSRQRG